MLKPGHANSSFQGRKFHNPTQCLTILMIRKLFTYNNEYPSKQHGNLFPLDWVFHSRLSLGSFPDMKTVIKILLLHSRRSWTYWPLPVSVPTGSFVPPPPLCRQCWVGQVSWEVRKWHLRTCWFIITRREVKLTTQDASWIAKGKVAPRFSSCLPFSWFLLVSIFKAVQSVEGYMCYSERSPAPPVPVSIVSELVFSFCKLIGLIFSFWLLLGLNWETSENSDVNG